MEKLSIMRKVDNLGRIVIPKEIIKALNIDKESNIEIFMSKDSIILKKYEPYCAFCGNNNNLRVYKNKKICSDCINMIKLYAIR